MEFLTDVFFLLVVCSMNNDIAEAEFRHFLFECHAFLLQQAIVHTARYPVLDGIHQFHGTLIADVVEFVKAVEIHQIHIIVLESHQNAQ